MMWMRDHVRSGIALCESWAGFIGYTYAHRTYGDEHSSYATWETRLERAWNETNNHVPVGLYHDLVDDEEKLFSRGGAWVTACDIYDPYNCTVIDDRVESFSIAQMFSCLVPGIGDIPAFKSLLVNQHLGSTSNTSEQVNALFNSY